jgi:6,7-dimethyl-8-ribityllumazine synthase
MRLGIVASRFNESISTQLIERAKAAARGVMDVALEFGLPIANGILTTEDEAQALARLDKGAEAVKVAVEMAKLKERMHEER